ncbi:MAG: carboxypeptidase-like regulatory domain-containing protein [Ignavibacteriaceae bacterium]
MKTLFFIIFNLTVYAQTGTIIGKVLDKETGETLTGAMVIIKELNIGAATDINGEYNIINVKSGLYSLFAAFGGYIKQYKDSINVHSNFNVVNFELEPDSTISQFIIYERPITKIKRSCEPPYDFLKPRGLFIDTLIHSFKNDMSPDSVKIK